MSGHRVLSFAMAGVLVFSLGCSGITVRRLSQADPFRSWQASLSPANQVSPRSQQTLRQLELESMAARQPAEAFARLQSVAAEDPQPDYLFTLAEMSFHLGTRAEKDHQPDAIALYYLCAGYSYHYLFPRTLPPDTSSEVHVASFVPHEHQRRWEMASFDPRFRLACDLYNSSLAKCIRAAQRVGHLNPCSQLLLPTHDGQAFVLSVVHQGFAWKPDDFGPLQFSDDYEVRGLANKYRSYGLGVPLIGTRAQTEARIQNARLPKDLTFPVTAFFRFEGSVADLTARRAGRLELINPLALQTVNVGGRLVPLELDLTTPMALFLSRTDLDDGSLTGLLNADKVASKTGIYMTEPYQPGKIPVLFVHGLLSSPITWAPLVNDLQADPVVRQKYQIWFYLYPTVNPYVVTAADLRQRLTALRDEIDPLHRDQALDRMVLVGHSMGGLVSRMLTTSSGDDYWQLVSSEPFEKIQADPSTRADLQRVFFFDRLPNVQRVIYLGTPHRGSRLSPSPPVRLASKLIRLPSTMVKLAREIGQANPKAIDTVAYQELPISLDMLAPESPALKLLGAQPKPLGVSYHSIVGVVPIEHSLVKGILPGGRSKEGTDGVVPYTSAHLDQSESEVVVPADHFGVHHHPRSVAEVRRILRLHANQP